MKFGKRALMLLATVAAAGGVSDVAQARPQGTQGTQAQRAANERATAELRARIVTTDQRIAEGRSGHAISRARAATLHRQVGQVRASMSRLSRQQGFVSAAELASYNRTLGAIDVELDRRGVARSYGNDALVAPDRGGQTGAIRYDCQNEPIMISVGGGRLDHALAELSRVTRCPISGTDLARGKQTGPVEGTMTPGAALQAMLRGTGLRMRTIRQGFTVVRLPR